MEFRTYFVYCHTFSYKFKVQQTPSEFGLPVDGATFHDRMDNKGAAFQHLQCDWKLQRFTQQIQEYKMTNLESHSLHLPKVANIGPFGHRKDCKRIWVLVG